MLLEKYLNFFVIGAVFGWGKNTFGQLGLNDTQDRNLPCQLQTLQNAKICYAACGEEFSAFLTVVSILTYTSNCFINNII